MNSLRSDSTFASAFRKAQSLNDSKDAQAAQEAEYVMKRVATPHRGQGFGKAAERAKEIASQMKLEVES
jgi:hypothetical protein